MMAPCVIEDDRDENDDYDDNHETKEQQQQQQQQEDRKTKCDVDSYCVTFMDEVPTVQVSTAGNDELLDDISIIEHDDDD